MARGKRYTTEQIIHKLGEADVLIAQGVAVKEVSRRRVCLAIWAAFAKLTCVVD